MTLPDSESIKRITPMAAIIAIAIGGYWFMQRDVRAEMANQHEDLRQHIAITKDAIGRRDTNDAELLRMMRELVEVNREVCINEAIRAKRPEQVHACMFPGSPR